MYRRLIERIVNRIEVQGELPDSPGRRVVHSGIHLCAGACVVSEVLRERAGASAAAMFDEAVTAHGGKSLLVAEAERLGIAPWVKALITENDQTEPALRSARLVDRISGRPTLVTD